MKSNNLEPRLRKILEAVTQRVTERVDSLDPVFTFKTGLEGWFTVELGSGLERQGEKVERLQNKGPDILLTEDLQIELKGASDFNPSYLSSGALKDNVPCIFLGSGVEIHRIEKLRADPRIHVIDIKIIGMYGDLILNGTTFQTIFGLKSTWFDFEFKNYSSPYIISFLTMIEIVPLFKPATELIFNKFTPYENNIYDLRKKRWDIVTFSGKGWGHGVGMSQWGAQGLSENGFNYIDILKHFLSSQYKILPRKRTLVCAKHQRVLAKAVKRARQMSLIPTTLKH